MKFYVVNSTWLFEVRDKEGKIEPGTSACYLVRKVGDKYYRWCVMFKPSDVNKDKDKIIEKAAKRFKYKLQHKIATEVNMDGGSFGLEKDN